MLQAFTFKAFILIKVSGFLALVMLLSPTFLEILF